MKLGVYVGSFDPVHKGHKGVIDYLIDNKYIDKMLLIPTESYWDKNDLIDIHDRLNMLKKYESEKIIVTDKYSNFRRTHEILSKLKDDFEAELHLIIGADNLLKFHLWENIDDILNNKVVVLGRNDINMEEHIEKFEKKDSFILLKDFPQMSISSTTIRKNLKDRHFEAASECLDNEIFKYIIENNLYH